MADHDREDMTAQDRDDLEHRDQTADERVAATMAAQGVPVGSVPPGGPAKSTGDLVGERREAAERDDGPDPEVESGS